MAIQYEKNVVVTVPAPTGTSDTVTLADDSASLAEQLTAVIDHPGRCFIDFVAARDTATNTAANFTIYSRDFVGPAVDLRHIGDAGNGKIAIRVPYDKLLVRPGDTVSILETSGYDGDYRVLSVETPSFVYNPQRDGYQIIYLDGDFVSEEVATGRAYLNIPEDEWNLYLVATGTELSDVVSFVNRDVAPLASSTGVPRKLYMRFDAAGTYAVTLRSVNTIGF